MKIKTCGRASSCDLVIDEPTLADIHARVELAEDGLVRLHAVDTEPGTFLQRNDSWIQVRKATLCIGDRIYFGEVEVPLEQLTAVFGNDSNARLEARHFPPRHKNRGVKSYAAHLDDGPLLQKPRRNPVTGKIEENRPGEPGAQTIKQEGLH